MAIQQASQPARYACQQALFFPLGEKKYIPIP